MLNQTNIGHNNNKYYVIQVLKANFGNNYYAWNRWGRVVSINCQGNQMDILTDLV